MADSEPFLARWSRRKLDTTKADQTAGAEIAPGSRPAADLPAEPNGPQAPERPATGTPEYREFFDPRVDEKLRRTALKKLFSEPRFNVMDGLDTYIDDYSIPDPIPQAMLRQLNQAKDLFLFDDEKQAGDGAGAAAAVAAGDSAPAGADGASPLPHLPPAGASDEAAGAATNGAVPLRAESLKNA